MGHLPELPIVKDILCREIELPFSFALAGARCADDPGTVVLLSGSRMDSARYHCLATAPWLALRGYGTRMDLGIRDPGCTGLENQDSKADWVWDGMTPGSGDPLDLLEELLARYTLDGFDTDLPCASGFFGYFSYDLKDRIEALPRTCVGPVLPDICLYAPSVLLIRDRQAGKTHVCTPVFDQPSARDRARDRADAFLNKLDRPWSPKAFSIDARGFTSSFAKPDYMESVAKVIDYLRAGDIYQANLSQRFETGFKGDPYSLFLELYRRNPAPFFSFIHAGDHHVVSTSPERFIQAAGRDVETRPIKGTIARGKTPETDRENGRILSSSTKDDAELTMIVDLMRNDLSRVTEHGSVEVTEHKRLEPYENVFHLVSVVKGRLAPDKTAVDLIRATFPGGSITGCPKIRAMEIIDELEPVKRHVYTGSIGYLSFHGTLDLSIAIRTATIQEDRLVFSVGGGIVYDSDPEKEFQETLDKGKTLMETLVHAGERLPVPIKAWVNGRLVDQDRACVPAVSQGFQYGAGLFETIRVENGVPLRLGAHIRRMETAWTQLFDIPVPDITWDRVIESLVRENRFKDRVGAVKLIMARDGRPGRQVHLSAFIRPYVHRLETLGKSGLDIEIFQHPRQNLLADHKTLNYLYYERAGAWARDRGADEALILNADRSVSETNTGNIIAVANRTLILPQSPHVLDGVAQAAVIEAMSAQGYKVRDQKMVPDQLAAYSNVMVTNALMGAVPVNSINGRALDWDPGVVARINHCLQVRN